MYDFEKKPHGEFEPHPERGAYIHREPKGDPDMLFFSGPEGFGLIMDAARLLSVQGYTARIVMVNDPALFARQPGSYYDEVFPESIPARIGYASDEAEDTAFSGYGGKVLTGSVMPQEFSREALAFARTFWT